MRWSGRALLKTRRARRRLRARDLLAADIAACDRAFAAFAALAAEPVFTLNGDDLAAVLNKHKRDRGE